MSSHISALNPPRAVYSVIGAICKDPQLLRDPEVILSEKDFEQEFHRVIFSAVYNMAYGDIETKTVTAVDIDNYLASYPQLYVIWEKFDGRGYVQNSINNSNPETFKHNYDRLKKFSCLRHYVLNGIDVSDLINYQSTDLSEQEAGMKMIDGMTVKDIIDHYTKKMIDTRDSFDVGKLSEDFSAGDDLETLLEKLNKEPEFGLPFQNSLYNAIFRGMRKEKLMLRSAGTGTGKTRQALMDICNVSCDEIYDYDKGWISNGPAFPTVYISTEIEKEEVQSIMLAFISGVDEEVIKDGCYAKPVLERLQYAIGVIKRAPIYCVYIDDFSISDIELIIERYIIEKKISVCAFDYIQMTPKLSKTMSQSFGSSLREDQILVQFSAALKNLAKKYKIFLTTSTQLNRNSKDIEMRDTSSLRGGSATADKVDFGLITFKVTSVDLNNLKHILEHGFHKKPNYSHWIYKNRSGLSDAIIWSDMNLGTMREEPLFVTDRDFNILEIAPVEVTYKTEETLDF